MLRHTCTRRGWISTDRLNRMRYLCYKQNIRQPNLTPKSVEKICYRWTKWVWRTSWTPTLSATVSRTSNVRRRKHCRITGIKNKSHWTMVVYWVAESWDKVKPKTIAKTWNKILSNAHSLDIEMKKMKTCHNVVGIFQNYKEKWTAKNIKTLLILRTSFFFKNVHKYLC